MELDHLGLPESGPGQNTPEQESAHKAEQEKFLANVPHVERLDAQENFLKRREENINAVKPYRFEHQEEVTQERPGMLLHHSQFMYRLKRVRPDAFFNDFSAMGRIGLNVIQDGMPTYVTTVQLGISPEYSTMRTDEHGLPTKERYRGWRTALLHLIMGGFITEEQANRAFGEASGNEASHYLRTLWQFRNHKKYA